MQDWLNRLDRDVGIGDLAANNILHIRNLTTLNSLDNEIGVSDLPDVWARSNLPFSLVGVFSFGFFAPQCTLPFE